MKTSFTITRRNELSTAKWSGGTTTQLAIWPEGADYATRNFVWRVSTARVEAEESEFTSLPGISRILMVLDGELLLRHEGRGETRLDRFGQDSFMGDWKTSSRGRVTDFNLMISDGAGAVEALEITPGGECRITRPNVVDGENTWLYRSEIFYSLSDGMEMLFPGGETRTLDNGDVALIHSPAGDTRQVSIKNPAGHTAHVIRTTVFHN